MMKKRLSYLFVWVVSLFTIPGIQAQDSCARLVKTVDSLLVLAKGYAKDKKFISAESYFKGAGEWKDAYPDCFSGSGIQTDEYLAVVPPSTYQKLLEEVLLLQESNKFDEALSRYAQAGNYFVRYEVSLSGLNHLPVEDFLFAYGKGGFVKHYINKLIGESNYSGAMEMYCRMLDKGIPPDELKRPLYDLGVLSAQSDKLRNPSESQEKLLSVYIAKRKDLRFFEMGYKFGWRHAR